MMSQMNKSADGREREMAHWQRATAGSQGCWEDVSLCQVITWRSGPVSGAKEQTRVGHYDEEKCSTPT